jgi:hypothetical protein
MPCDSITTISLNLDGISKELLEKLYPGIHAGGVRIPLDNGLNVLCYAYNRNLTIETDSPAVRDAVESQIRQRVTSYAVSVASQQFGWQVKFTGKNKMKVSW